MGDRLLAEPLPNGIGGLDAALLGKVNDYLWDLTYSLKMGDKSNRVLSALIFVIK